MAYRFRDPTPVFDNLLGTEPAPGGMAYFYEIGTSTPKDTFQDYDLTTPNTNPIILTSAGRFPFPVWMDGDYTYELKAANGSSIINPTDIRPEIAPGEAIPDPLGHDGEYLTVVAGEVAWSGPVWSLPDPTGSAGDMVVVDSSGTTYVLQAQPEIPEPDITVATNSVIFGSGTGDKWMVQKGSGTAPASGALQTTLPVSFSPAFKSGTVPHVNITAAPGAQPQGPVVPYLTAPPTASGFTAGFDVAEGSSSGQNITSAVFFLWEASGVYDG